MARGYIYEVATDPDCVGCMTEWDFYGLVDHEFDYCHDEEPTRARELAADFIGMLEADGVQVEGNKIVFTRDAKVAYFGDRLSRVKAMVAEMTEEDFATSVGAVQTLLENKYEDAVCFDGAFYTLDDFVRTAEIGKPYYVGNNVVSMH